MRGPRTRDGYEIRRIGGRWAAVQPTQRPSEAPVRSFAVRPLPPAVEQAKLDRARQYIKTARQKRNYETPVDWWTGRVGAQQRQQHW